MRSIYCCVAIEFIQPWDQEKAIRQVKELGLGNAVMLESTFHLGNSDEERRKWKARFPHAKEPIDATPQFPERPSHGMTVSFDVPVEFRIEQLRLCRKLGLKVFFALPQRWKLPASDFDRLSAAGEGIILTELIMCESTSVLATTLGLEQLKAIDAAPLSPHAGSYAPAAPPPGDPWLFEDIERLDFRMMHDWFVSRFRAVGDMVRSRWSGQLGAIEATTQLRLAMQAGAEIPILELVPHEPLRGLAAVRGAAKAYGQPLWGVHTAMGYYRAPTDLWSPERLRIALALFYAGGAGFFDEPNMPLRNWGLCSGFFSIPASPPIVRGEEECRGFDDPLCARAREVVADHYRFTQFHQRPSSTPRVKLGFVLGHLDGWTGGHQDGMWMVDHPGLRATDALATWGHFENVYESEPWYVPPRKYYWQADPAKPLHRGTPPCGQVDIVPLEAPQEVLNSYGCLVFLGWNTMTDEHYARLRAFVERGGTLFLSVPHLSTRVRVDRPQEFIHAGDVRDLCGVRVLGAGEKIEEVYLAQQALCERHDFPQGALYLEEATLARIELCGARVLAHPRGKPEQPVLLEHRRGNGRVYLLNTWEYPGARLDAFVTDILRTLAEGEQGDIAVESRDVFYSVYDGGMPSGLPCSTVYLVNHDIYAQPVHPSLIVRGRKVSLRVPGDDMRIAWVCGGLVVSPHDRFVKVTDVREDGCARIVTLESQPLTPGAAADAERVIQIESTDQPIARVELDGRPLAIEHGAEGTHAVRCRLTGRNAVRLELPEGGS